jgi:hypothetical protein
MATSRVSYFLLAFAMLGVATGGQTACGSSSNDSVFDAGSGDVTTGDDSGAVGDAAGGDGSVIFGGGGDGAVNTQGLDVEPVTLQTIKVTIGTQMPTVTYTATNNGSPVNVGWSVDAGNIGTLAAGPSSTGVFIPTGTTGGIVDVLATFGNQTLKRQVLVELTAPTQNGPNTSNAEEQAQIPANQAALSAGGGVGGVGGEGLGTAVTNMATLTALANPTGDAMTQNLQLLYPYNKTVWPRGMLAPLLMWSWTPGNADAIQIQLTTTSSSFSWTGVFGPPEILGATGTFIRAPIPQDIWDIATNTAGGLTSTGAPDQLMMTLTVASGGVGYALPVQTWPVAPARLTGTVYYNSYGTQLVQNWVNKDKAGNWVGAAILGVKSGVTAPALVVGENSVGPNAPGGETNDNGCRVCHVVSSHGRWLLTQSEQGNPNDGQSFLYDLTAANVQGSAATVPQQGVFTWAAMTNDGAYALTNTVNPSSSNPGLNTSTSAFYSFGPTPAAATLLGLPTSLAMGYPTYSPDDTFVAYIDVTGSTGNVDGPLKLANYTATATSQTLGTPQTLASPTTGQRVGYPAFLPDDSGILFETEVRPAKGMPGSGDNQSDTVMVTRNGARGELWWVNATGTPTPTALTNLNGKGYLPIGGNNHGSGPNVTDPEDGWSQGTTACATCTEVGWDDTTVNYEPTVLPVASGGYAWVVFTSRRLYGNQLTETPWLSWPPDYNTQSLGQATVKKLWVAAIDLSAAPGTDPSHPAFYLPAQEILAGNSRGFWVLNPCEQDGISCTSGDQCCNGYCEPNGDGGALICSTATTTCSPLSDKCTTASDCCDPTNKCINGFCALPGPS